jgi:hypothetical protein
VDEGARFKPRIRRRSDTKPRKIEPSSYNEPLTRVKPAFRTGSQGVGLSLALSPSERLCSAFVNVLKIENPPYSLLTLGEFTRYVPLLVGHGKAVDSVVASLLSSHERLLRSGDPSSRIDPGLYTRALCNMQRELNDPERWRSSSTLCAAVLLHRMEVNMPLQFDLLCFCSNW